VDPTAVAVVVLGYVLGSVDFGVIAPRLRGVDIYSRGSGNPGATNVLRTMGRKMAATVMLGDLAKGLVAAVIGDLVAGPAIGFATGFAAVLGHCFPLWHHFKGGKGVATTAGMVLWLEPLAALALIAGWASIVALTKRASIASLVVAIALVPALAATGHRGWSLAWAGGAAILIAARHQANIRRLLAGSEPAIETS